MPGIDIRTATSDDVAILLDFIRRLAEYERLLHEVSATEELLSQHLFGPERRAEAVLAYDDGQPAGFALFFHNFSTFLGRPGLYLEDLFVLPEKRGRGIGKALLLHLARLARDRGCGRFEWAVLNWNEPALGFYRSLGAVPLTDWSIHRVTGEALDALAEQAGKELPHQ